MDTNSCGIDLNPCVKTTFFSWLQAIIYTKSWFHIELPKLLEWLSLCNFLFFSSGNMYYKNLFVKYNEFLNVKYKISINPNITNIFSDFDYLGLHFLSSQSNHKLLQTQLIIRGKPNIVHDKALKYVS
jgi:hypothetical protein